MKKAPRFRKPDPCVYAFGRCLSHHYCRKMHVSYIRDELRNASGPAVVLAAHTSGVDQYVAALACKKRMHFVTADPVFYSKGHFLFKWLRVIHKLQFFTKPSELKAMRDVLHHNGILVLYPAGLCTADGVSTYVSPTLGKFLKFCDAEVYIIHESGAYLSNPKWSKIKREGKVEADVYRLLKKEEVEALPFEEIAERAIKALRYDDYAWEEEKQIPFKNGNNVMGLENVLYSCPCCHSHFSMAAKDNRLVCKDCGFSAVADDYGLLHGSEENVDVRHPATWHRALIEDIKKTISKQAGFSYRLPVSVQILNREKCKFQDFCKGYAMIKRDCISIENEEKSEFYNEKTCNFFSIPNIPGEYFDLQDGESIYRCYPKEPKDASYVTDIVIALFELRQVK